jgi:hypothetical protein
MSATKIASGDKEQMPGPTKVPYWLSYGGGVNSTALAVLLCSGRLPQYEPWRVVWADTGTEKDETYTYLNTVFIPYLSAYGKQLETVTPTETVIGRWERLRVTGSRRMRTCTDYGKVKPINAHIAANGGGDTLIGIDAGEIGRARDREGVHYPLVEMWLTREDCVKVIQEAGLPVPVKSGCWCCPFMRTQEVLDLAKNHPCRFERIARLEKAASETHGGYRYQWGDSNCDYWRTRASAPLLDEIYHDEMPPCGCYDG